MNGSRRRLRTWTGALIAGGLLGAPSAAAADARDTAWPKPADAAVLSDANHVVHYSVSGVGTETAQASLAQLASARAVFLGMGFRAPPTDAGRGGDDRYDLYLCTNGTVCFGRSTRGGAAAELNTAQPSGPATGYGFLFLNGAQHPATLLAHEYFHAWQQGYLGTFSHGAPWWGEITAEWAANQVAAGATIGIHMDNIICAGSGDPVADPCVNGSYRHYPFVTYLVGRFGLAILHEVFAEQVRLAAATPGVGHGRAALENALIARGSSLAAEFAGFARASIIGGFGGIALGSQVYSDQTEVIDTRMAAPVAIGPWGMRFRFLGNSTLRPNVTPPPIGVDVQGLDPALDGAAIGTQHLAIPPSGALQVLVPGNMRLQFSFTSASDAPRTVGFQATRRVPVMTMSAGPRPARRRATAIRVACPTVVGGCRARFVLRFGSGRRAITRTGPIVELADGASRVVTVALGTRLALRLRGRRRARMTVEQIQRREAFGKDVAARQAITLALR